jgi:hypothetical protein
VAIALVELSVVMAVAAQAAVVLAGLKPLYTSFQFSKDCSLEAKPDLQWKNFRLVYYRQTF